MWGRNRLNTFRWILAEFKEVNTLASPLSYDLSPPQADWIAQRRVDSLGPVDLVDEMLARGEQRMRSPLGRRDV